MIKRILNNFLLAVLAISGASVSALAQRDAPQVPAVPWTYTAMGDSLAAGVGATTTSTAYVGLYAPS